MPRPLGGRGDGLVKRTIHPRQTSLTTPRDVSTECIHLGADGHYGESPAIVREARQPVFGSRQRAQRPPKAPALHVVPGDSQLQDAVVKIAHRAAFGPPCMFERLVRIEERTLIESLEPLEDGFRQRLATILVEATRT